MPIKPIAQIMLLSGIQLSNIIASLG